MKKWQLYILIFALIGVIIMMHNCRGEPETKIEYIEGERIIDSVLVPVPYAVEVPSEPEYIYKTKYDTIREIDTVEILTDWTLKRKYSQTLFDNDTLGEMTIDLSVQYNQLQSIKYDFKPKQKVITKTNPPQRLGRSEEHTSELQSRFDLVCGLLLEKKKKEIKPIKDISI